MAFLPGRDYSNTLLALKRDPILSLCEKLTLYFLDRLGWRWDIKSINSQLVVEARI